MKYLALALTLVSSIALADGNVDEYTCKPKVVIKYKYRVDVQEKIVYKDKIVYVDKIVYKDRVKHITKIRYKQRKNHLQLFIADTPDDALRSSADGNSITVSSTSETAVGVGYSRSILFRKDWNLSLGAHYFSNEHIGLNLGIHY